MLFFQMMTMIILMMLMITLVQIFNQQSMMNRSKNSPFECGFDPYQAARMPFSLRFFMLAIIFLIFDIEIALLFPLILTMKVKFFKISLMAGTIFLMVLTIGLIHEWNQGTLSWVK